MRIQLALLAFLGSATVAHAAAPLGRSKAKPTLAAIGREHLSGVKMLIAGVRKGTIATEIANPEAGRVTEHVSALIITRNDIVAASRKMSVAPVQDKAKIAESLGLSTSELMTLRYTRAPELEYATKQIATSVAPQKLYNGRAIAVEALLDQAKGDSKEARQIRAILGHATSSPAALATFMHEARQLYGSPWQYGPRRSLGDGKGGTAPPEARKRVYKLLRDLVRSERPSSYDVSNEMDALFAIGAKEAKAK